MVVARISNQARKVYSYLSKMRPSKAIAAHGTSSKKLTLDERLNLLEQARWTEKLKLPGYDLRFRIRSRTEFKRIRRVKETWTIDWINQIPEKSVLWDVGANIGIMTTVAAVRPEVEKVVSIEPFFLNYPVIVENLLLNNLSHKVIVFCGGLGEVTSIVPLKLQNLVEGGALHSFGDIFKMGTRSTESVGEQSSVCMRVDDLVKLDGIPFPTHMKVDIDGFELDMLRGAPETLSDPRMVGIQIETMDHDDDLPQRNAVSALLESHGFSLKNYVVHESPKAKVYDLQFVKER